MCIFIVQVQLWANTFTDSPKQVFIIPETWFSTFDKKPIIDIESIDDLWLQNDTWAKIKKDFKYHTNEKWTILRTNSRAFYSASTTQCLNLRLVSNEKWFAPESEMNHRWNDSTVEKEPPPNMSFHNLLRSEKSHHFPANVWFVSYISYMWPYL